MSYEKLFVGPAFAVRNYNFLNTPWDEFHSVAEDFMATYGTQEKNSQKSGEAAAKPRLNLAG
jgi:hypothetical protein